jgi:hypothetical protein
MRLILGARLSCPGTFSRQESQQEHRCVRCDVSATASTRRLEHRIGAIDAASAAVVAEIVKTLLPNCG